MIDTEILDAVRDEDLAGERLDEILNQFRSGRNTDEVVVLLESSDPELVSIGAYFLSELHFHKYNTRLFISRLEELTSHEDASVRLHALNALYPALDRTAPTTRSILQRMSLDSNEGVRQVAEAAAVRLSLKLPSSLHDAGMASMD